MQAGLSLCWSHIPGRLKSHAMAQFMFILPSLLATSAYLTLVRSCSDGILNRGCYTSTHIILNLLYKVGKRDKMQGSPSILSLFQNELNKFNNTRAQMLGSIYHIAFKLLKNHFFV